MNDGSAFGREANWDTGRGGRGSGRPGAAARRAGLPTSAARAASRPASSQSRPDGLAKSAGGLEEMQCPRTVRRSLPRQVATPRSSTAREPSMCRFSCARVQPV